MLSIITERSFKKSVKRAQKRGKDLNKLWLIVEKLQKCEALEIRHRAHRLSGDWHWAWECHIEPDWLLIYHITDQSLILVETGTHSDLFE